MRASLLALPLAVFAITACGSEIDVSAESTVGLAAKAAPKPAQLNLSHIACTDDGTVLAHFVLLFAGTSTPGTLSGGYYGAGGAALPFGPAQTTGNTGNVWHFNVILPSGYIDISGATVTTSTGAVVTLHNPGEYAGDYQCQCEEIAGCPVAVSDATICTDQPLGNPDAECASIGLVLIGKDDNVTCTTFASTKDAYAALIKSGSGGCSPGSSAYRIEADVSVGQILVSPSDQAISHVTYCACPEG